MKGPAYEFKAKCFEIADRSMRINSLHVVGAMTNSIVVPSKYLFMQAVRCGTKNKMIQLGSNPAIFRLSTFLRLFRNRERSIQLKDCKQIVPQITRLYRWQSLGTRFLRFTVRAQCSWVLMQTKQSLFHSVLCVNQVIYNLNVSFLFQLICISGNNTFSCYIDFKFRFGFCKSFFKKAVNRNSKFAD